MDVVSDAEPVAAGGLSATGCDIALEPSLGVFDLFDSELVVVVRVDIEVSNMVAEIGHSLLAARDSGAARIRRAHVGGEEAENVTHGHFELVHLVLALCLIDGT